MHLTIDFETRSSGIDLKFAGSRRYAEDPGTQIMCLALLVDGKTTFIHIPAWVLVMHPGIEKNFPFITMDEVGRFIKDATTIEAHNASFEMDLWNNCFWPLNPLPLEKMYCSAAKSAMHALPRALGQACSAIRSGSQKDMAGNALMMKMCKPRRALKADQERDPDWETKVYWHETREQFEGLFKYCIQDVISEHSFSSLLRELPASERAVWILDQKINQRGIEVDLPHVEKLLEMVKVNEIAMKEEFKDIVKGNCTPSQVAKVLGLLVERGVYLPNLQKETVLSCLASEEDMDPVAKRILELRLGTAKTSTAKFQVFLNMACEDSRVRGLLLYHGADTGRWAGQKIQPQNLPSRNVLKHKQVDEMFKTLMETTDPNVIEMLYGPPLWCASSAIRACFVAPHGKVLVSADYSAIEGRVLAWLAGEEYILDAYRNGVDTYLLAAAGIYHVPVESVTPEQRQIGKVVELACGYQGGGGAFLKMAQSYGVKVPEDEAKRIVAEWREVRPETKRYWNMLEKAARDAVKNPGQQFRYRNVTFKSGNICIKPGVSRSFLCCRLPSGRMLHYPFPEITMKKVPWGDTEMKETISFWGVNSLNHRWEKQYTYGGKLAENITQAVSRDLLAEAMLRLESTGKYPVVLHVHDECVSECNEGEADLDEYCGIMSELPEWAAGLPVVAKGWIGKRYRK